MVVCIGLICGCEPVDSKSDREPFDLQQGVGAYCATRCQERGLRDTIAICPPLIITEAQINDLFDRFVLALDDTEA